MDNKPNLIVDLTFSFSLKVIYFTEILESKKKFNMANQLFRAVLPLVLTSERHKVQRVKLILDINVK